MTIHVLSEADNEGRTYSTYTCGYCFKKHYTEKKASECGKICVGHYSTYRDNIKRRILIEQAFNKVLKIDPNQGIGFSSDEVRIKATMNAVEYSIRLYIMEDIKERIGLVSACIYGGEALYEIKSNSDKIGMITGDRYTNEREGFTSYRYAYPHPQNTALCALVKEDVDRLAKIVQEELLIYVKGGKDD